MKENLRQGVREPYGFYQFWAIFAKCLVSREILQSSQILKAKINNNN